MFDSNIKLCSAPLKHPDLYGTRHQPRRLFKLLPSNTNVASLMATPLSIISNVTVHLLNNLSSLKMADIQLCQIPPSSLEISCHLLRIRPTPRSPPTSIQF